MDPTVLIVDHLMERLERIELHLARTCMLAGGSMCGELFSRRHDIHKGFRGDCLPQSWYAAVFAGPDRASHETVVSCGHGSFQSLLDSVREELHARGVDGDSRGCMSVDEVSPGMAKILSGGQDVDALDALDKAAMHREAARISEAHRGLPTLRFWEGLGL